MKGYNSIAEALTETSKRKLGSCTRTAFTCPVPGSMPGSRTGRGSVRVGGEAATVCQVLEGWMGNYLGGGPPCSDAISAFGQK